MARWGWLLACLALAVFASLFPREAQAHPLGNFTINHHSSLEFAGQNARITYVLDLAEIPTLQQRESLDADGEKLSGKESDAYLDAEDALPRGRPEAAGRRRGLAARGRRSLGGVPARPGGAPDPAHQGQSAGRASEKLARSGPLCRQYLREPLGVA